MKKLLLLLALSLTVTQLSFAEKKVSAAAFMPLSGPWSPNGEYTREGIEMAEKSLVKDGINLDVKIEDACLANDTVKALKSLTINSSIDGIVANYCVLGLAAIESMVRRDKLVTFHNSIVPGNLIDNKDNIYTTFPTTEEEAVVIADYAYNKLGARKAAVLQLISQWGEGFTNGFVKHFKKLGGTIVSLDESPTPVTDFRPELSRLKNTDADVVFAVHVGADLVLALKQMASLGINIPVLTTSEAYDDHVTREGGKTANGLTFFIPTLDPENSYVKRLFTDYPEVKNQALRPLTSHAYISSVMFAKGKDKCTEDSACLTKFLNEQVTEFRGGTNWHKDNFTSIKVENGKFKEIS